MRKNFICISYKNLDIVFPNESVEASMYAGQIGDDSSKFVVEYKKNIPSIIYLDTHIHQLFNEDTDGNAYTALFISNNLFSKKVIKQYGNKKTGCFAFLTTAVTRVIKIDVAEFRFLPGSLGISVQGKGLIAVRFSLEGRIQLLIDFDKLLIALMER